MSQAVYKSLITAVSVSQCSVWMLSQHRLKREVERREAEREEEREAEEQAKQQVKRRKQLKKQKVIAEWIENISDDEDEETKEIGARRHRELEVAFEKLKWIEYREKIEGLQQCGYFLDW